MSLHHNATALLHPSIMYNCKQTQSKSIHLLSTDMTILTSDTDNSNTCIDNDILHAYAVPKHMLLSKTCIINEHTQINIITEHTPIKI